MTPENPYQPSEAPQFIEEKNPWLHLLKLKNFSYLWSGTFISSAGLWVQIAALGWVTYEITQNEALVVIVSAMRRFPEAMLGPFIGTLADLIDRRKLLILCEFALGLNGLFLGLITSNPKLLPEVYSLFLLSAILSGTVQAIERPARSSFLSGIVYRRELPTAVPLMSMSVQFARFLGSYLTGWMLVSWGAPGCFYFNAISYLALIVALFMIRDGVNKQETVKFKTKGLWFQGIQYAFTDLRIRFLFMLEAFMVVFGNFYVALMPVIAKDLFGLNQIGYGKIMAAVGIGNVLGLLALTIFNRDLRLRKFFYFSAMLFMGVALILLTMTQNLLFAYFLFAICGWGSLVMINITLLFLQMNVPDEMKGRLFSIHLWIAFGLGGFFYPLLGYLCQVWTTHFVLSFCGWIVLVAGVLGYLNRGALQRSEQNS